MRSLRLLPVVIVTSMTLLGLKAYQWASGPEGSLLGVEMATAQDAGADVAGSIDPTGEDAMDPDDTMAAAMDGAEDMSGADVADGADMVGAVEDPLESVDQVDLPVESSRERLLERLGERRVLMEEREQDLRVREQLLAAAERRLEERMQELEALEARIATASDAEEQRASEEIGRLVQVYSAMRAKDAAAIFDLLDLPILMDVANAMNPRKMADILGEMNPEAARRLTIAIAGTPVRTAAEPEDGMSALPQIEGVPIQ